MRRTGFVGVGLVALLVVAGAVVSSVESSDEAAAPGDEMAATSAAGAPEPAIAGSRGVAADVAGSGSVGTLGLPQTVAPSGPRVVRTADLSVEVGKDRFAGAFDRATSIATSHGGYVTSSGTGATGDSRRPTSGQLTLRVPADRFDDARRALGQLGEVRQEGVRGEDVSGQLVDYEARLRNLRAQEESLQGLLGRASNVGEVMQVQTTLFGVRQQIEQLDAQRAQLDQAAALATIQLSLYEPGAAGVFRPEPEPEPATGLAGSFERAVDGAVAVVGGMIVVLGYATPLAVLGLLGWGVLRLRRRPVRAPAPAATA